MTASNIFKDSLARKIGVYVIIFSTCVTLFTSGIQLYSEYKRDVSSIHARLDQLERTQVDNIASRVWVLDTLELERTLNSLLNLPSIEYVAVYDYDRLLLSVGNDIDEKAIVETHRLLYEHNNEIHDIGSIVVKASLDEVYSLIIDRGILIILSNGLKTFLVAGFILFIFYQLVARHLVKISSFTKSNNFSTIDSILTLDRIKESEEKDELDVVVDSINTMHSEIREQFTEITNQKQYLSLTLNSIGDAVITTNIEGLITQMNSVAEKLTGWNQQEAENKPVMSVFQVKDSKTSESIGDLTNTVLSSNKPIRQENNTVLLSRDGNEYHISYTAAPIKDENVDLLGIVLIFHDITEQHELREEFAKSKRDMQAIMDHSPAVIYIKDIQGKYLFINRRYEILFKLTREDVIGKADYDIFDKETASMLKRNDENVKRAGQALELEENIPHSDGEIHTYMAIKFPLLDENGVVYAICGISTDVTERKIQEKHFRRAQKMDALGKLTSGIAHDYNNMLGIILGYAQLLESSLGDNPNLQKYAKEVCRAGIRGSNLTKKLLEFSSQNVSDACSVNINNLLRGEQNMLEITLTPRINLLMELSENLWITHLNSGELEDAIVNICINAMHAIEESGEIYIRTSNKILLQKEAERLDVSPGNYIVLSISDTGRGMDEQTKERIFDPFYSTKGANGTGLGLSQVYGFMERNSGAIDVISSPGKGARFDLYFPTTSSSTFVSDRNDDQTLNYKLRGNETVLIVDDEPSLVNLLNEYLIKHGYNVLTANDGNEALNIIMNNAVDLVITDIIMPKVDGTQLVNEIKNRFHHIKMQMVSGYTDSKISSSIDRALAKNILYKPFSMEDLLSRVRTLLDEKLPDEKTGTDNVADY